MNKSQATPPDRSARLGLYCAAGAAVLAGTVTTSDAAIVYINFNNQTFSDLTPNDGLSTYFTAGNAGNFDFNNDGTIDFRLRNRVNFSGSANSSLAGFAAATGGSIDVVGVLAGVVYPSRLAAGTTIGPSGTFQTLASGATGYLASYSPGMFPNSQWATSAGAPGFIGVRFTAAGQTYFGWVGLTVNAAATGYTITLSGIAYENVPNTAITTGAVPEPASLALLALGAVGLVGYRRLQASKAKAV